MAPKNPHGVTLRDGHWYSIVAKYPRGHQHAKWTAAEQTFIWAGTSETKIVPLDEVDEIFNEVDPEFIGPGTTDV
jgi:hypothetical protein